MSENPDDFQIGTLYSLKQVFFQKEKRGDAVKADAEAALKSLQSGDGDYASLGDTASSIMQTSEVSFTSNDT